MVRNTGTRSVSRPWLNEGWGIGMVRQLGEDSIKLEVFVV